MLRRRNVLKVAEFRDLLASINQPVCASEPRHDELELYYQSLVHDQDEEIERLKGQLRNHDHSSHC